LQTIVEEATTHLTTLLHSKAGNSIVVKVLMPFLAVFNAIVISSGHHVGNYVFACLFLILAFFCMSVAVLEVRDGVVRYRRLVGWRPIARGEVVEARIEWAPFLGSIRLSRFVFPGGRLYFVLDANSNPNPFRKGEYPLLNYFRDAPSIDRQKATHVGPQESDAARRERGKDRSIMLKLVVVAVAGAFLSILSQILVPPASQHLSAPPVPTQGPQLVRILFRVTTLFSRFEIQLAFFVVLVFLAVYRWRRRDAWVFAFLTGFSLPYIMLRWLSA
jgi:hypothetical protein